MAVVYQGSGTLLGALTTADVTPAIPAHQADDILICITANRVITNTCATPSGWTLLYGPVDDTAWRSYVFWKRATSGAETDPLCNWTATSADKYAQVHNFRGAITTGSPFAATAWTDGATDPAVATGVTTAAAGQLVAAIGLCADNLSTGATVTATDPASFGTTNSHTTVTTGADATGFCYSAARTTAGATGNVSVDFNAAPLHWGILVAAFTSAPPPAGPTVTPFETANWNTTTTPLTITVPGAVTGDLILVMYGGDNGTGGGNVSAATVSTTSGSTSAWTEPEEGLAASSQAWASSAWATVTADGTVTVSLARTQSTGLLWGGMALLAHDHGGIGVHGRSAPSATETVSLTVSQDSAVGMIAFDWDALALVAFATAGGNVNEVQRARVGIGPDLSDYAAYYLGQAAGSWDYGIATSSTTNLHVIAVEVKAAGGGASIDADAALTATATHTATAVRAANASASLTGTATITATATVTRTATASLTGVATVTADAALAGLNATAALTATANTTATATVTRAAASSLTVTATRTATAAIARPATAALTATAGITASATVVKSASATLTATATHTATATTVQVATASLTATATITADGAVGVVALLTATATITATAVRAAAASAALTATATRTAAATVTRPASASVTATATITATATVTRAGAATLTATAGITATATVTGPVAALVPRPDGGTTTRPPGSTVARPGGGTTTRPPSIYVPRPLAGTTPRP